MLKQGVLNNSALQSAIGESSVIAPKSERQKRSVHAELLLTALIDAFSILVIFLLMSFSSTGEILFMSKDMQLPKAAMTEQLTRQPVVKVEQGKIFLEEKEVSEDRLVSALIQLRKKFQAENPGQEFPGMLTVQADRRVKFENLNGIVLASSQAGFSDIKFAVVTKN
ncbi:MAG TPA: biopolymer transporter ExbD [Bdellovibrionales bacterium]|nr:biopolymer transporter ExbD [Bdellovibrionales bacterium]